MRDCSRGWNLLRNSKLIFVGILLLTMATLDAAELKLSAVEIQRVLTGNTIEGIWRGTPYRSFFAADGTTIYAAQGEEPTIGRWQADSVKGQYCSKWGAFGWDCYDLYSDGADNIIWVVPSDGYRSTSSLLMGRQLD